MTKTENEHVPHSHGALLNLTVFVAGASVMMLELVGSRILAPYLGASVFVWTALIGTVLASLSVGYVVGGKLSDIRATRRELGYILLVSAALIGIAALVKEPVLSWLAQNVVDIRVASVLSTLVILAPASATLGMVQPYAAKLSLRELCSAGRVFGNLGAVSAIGSIVGTFLAGFFLVSSVSNTTLLYLVAISLFIFGSLNIMPLNRKDMLLTGLTFGVVTIGGGFGTDFGQCTPFNHWAVVESGNTRTLLINGNRHSEILIDSDELVVEYTKYYRLIDHFVPKVSSALMLGGGAYSYPKDYLRSHPTSSLDVVEIDAEITKAAVDHFRLDQENPNLRVFHQDARLFLNRNQHQYGAIMVDVFSNSLAVPFHLTTIENARNMHRSLSEDGVIIINIVSSVSGKKASFLNLQVATLRKVFPHVRVLPLGDPRFSDSIQNVMLVVSKEAKSFESENPELQDYLDHLQFPTFQDPGFVLTDDFAPVEQLELSRIKRLVAF